ncbi:TerC family protein [Paenibacillus wulumuqiensis]|uniref:TerC family protein n=1 Tax=Paenibacillus wulumuqiensis TaxID=1567107 RepID=UPI0006191A6A|nr:TerC family protein [Paenibacillus wulumuqiensis]
MELFTVEFWIALASIILIDLVLAGDNAIVIGMAARNIPKENQKKVIIWGTVGAFVIRAIATLLVVYLLNITGLRLVGGLALVYIAYKLLVEEKEDDNISASSQMWAAIRTIIIADAMMGLDNVLAVAGAAHGDFPLVVVGLAISIPIMVWCSTLILKLIERFPWIIALGSAILAWTAAKMIIEEPLIKMYFENGFIKYGFELVVIVLVVLIGLRVKKKNAEAKAAEEVAL